MRGPRRELQRLRLAKVSGRKRVGFPDQWPGARNLTFLFAATSTSSGVRRTTVLVEIAPLSLTANESAAASRQATPRSIFAPVQFIFPFRIYAWGLEIKRALPRAFSHGAGVEEGDIGGRGKEVTSRPPETRLGIAALAFASSAHPKPKMAVWAPGSPRSLRSGYSRLSLAWVDSEPAAPPAPLLRKPNGVRCGAISNDEIRSWRKHIMSRLRNFTARPPNSTAKPPSFTARRTTRLDWNTPRRPKRRPPKPIRPPQRHTA